MEVLIAAVVSLWLVQLLRPNDRDPPRPYPDDADLADALSFGSALLLRERDVLQDVRTAFDAESFEELAKLPAAERPARYRELLAQQGRLLARVARIQQERRRPRRQ